MAVAPPHGPAYRERVGRTPNEMPGRPVGAVVPTWSDNDDAGGKADRRRATVEWRRSHPTPSWWRRLLRRRSGADG